jgi:hypothetical protein
MLNYFKIILQISLIQVWLSESQTSEVARFWSSFFAAAKKVAPMV